MSERPEGGLDAEEVLARLRGAYAPPEYALVREVPSITGNASRRVLDALAMNLYPSQGLELHGFEVKVARGDWLREAKQPSKSAGVAEYVDRFWLAVGHGSIVAPAELPKPWGLLVPHGDGLRVAKRAAPLKPKPIDRDFLAALLRRATQAGATEAMLRHEHGRGYEEGAADGARRSERALAEATRELTHLRGTVAEFEAASGVSLTDEWRGARVGEAVRLVLEAGPEALRERLGRHVRIMRDRLDQLQILLDTKAPRGEVACRPP